MQLIELALQLLLLQADLKQLLFSSKSIGLGLLLMLLLLLLMMLLLLLLLMLLLLLLLIRVIRRISRYHRVWRSEMLQSR
jgi:hypothetical protein